MVKLSWVQLLIGATLSATLVTSQDTSCDTSTSFLCGTTCVLLNTPCSSGIPGLRRSLPQTCPEGYTACPTSKGAATAWECIDTSENVESCGGCIFNAPGQAQGEDCTAVEGVSETQCVFGTCQATSCTRGYAVSGNGCAFDRKRFWSGK